jgi:hypothetical protein
MTDALGQPSRGQDRKERDRAQLRERASTFIAPGLQPGERVIFVVFGQTRPRGTYGLEMLIGLTMLAMVRWYIVVLTDQRLFLLDCGRARRNAIGNRAKPQSIAWSELLGGVKVEVYEEGLLYSKLFLRRLADSGQIIRLHLPRTVRTTSRQIVEALGAKSTS